MKSCAKFLSFEITRMGLFELFFQHKLATFTKGSAIRSSIMERIENTLNTRIKANPTLFLLIIISNSSNMSLYIHI